MLFDAIQSVGGGIKTTGARVHDRNFLKALNPTSHSMVVFDKAYSYYHQLATWTCNSVSFVTRLKKNAARTVVETPQEQGKAMVPKEGIVERECFPEGENGKKQTKGKAKLQLKKLCYQDEKNRYYELLSNSMESRADEIAFLNKKQRGVEILFKKM